MAHGSRSTSIDTGRGQQSCAQCPHELALHEHLRRGLDCAGCDCPQFQDATSRLHRARTRVRALVAAGRRVEATPLATREGEHRVIHLD